MARKGFSLIEIIIILFIISIIVAFSLPYFNDSIEQTKAQSAQNNLLAIAAAQSKYYEDNNEKYCTNSGSPPCAGSSSSLFSALSLTIMPNDTFTYSCVVSGSSYQCTATDQKVTLTLYPNSLPPVICTPSSFCPSNLPSSD